jgi:hypothetical protein
MSGGTVVPGWATGPAHLADVTGQPSRSGERLPQQELDLGVGAAQIVRGPPGERVVHGGVQSQQQLLPLVRHTGYHTDI